ncbi:MAG TPA: KOW motif-containing protein [Polyangiaceae bacterium]|nr:KOW motif-containing protein [Polyangiaceae bacterium]
MSRAPQPPAAPLRRPGSAGTSLGLCREDFGAASEMGREDLHRRLGAWARGVAMRFQASGLPLDVFCVDEPAGASAFFVRPGTNLRDARAALVLGVAAGGVRAGLELTPAHVRRADARLSDAAHALSLSAALEALPEQFVVQLGNDDAPLQAPHLSMDDLRRRFAGGVTDGRPLWIGWSVERDLALEHAALLDEQLEDALAALAGVYELLAGDADGEAGDKSRGSRESHLRKGGNAAVRLRAKHRGGHETAGREEERERRTSCSTPPNRRANARAREERRDLEVDAEGELESDVPADASSRAAKSDDMKAAPRAIFRRRTLRAIGSKNDSSLPIERGSRVRVLEGPFSGKVGVVQELDGKGGARVMLGLLAVRLEVKNLTTHAQGRYRPVLSSSHRKPLPVRS